MSLTRSPCCHHLCFRMQLCVRGADRPFEWGALERVAIAGEQAFERNAYAIFFSVFLRSFAVMLFFQLRN